jgi:uncharacterized membrane protein
MSIGIRGAQHKMKLLRRPEIEENSNQLLTVWARIINTSEGRVLVAGLSLTLVGLLVMGLIALWDPAMSRMIGVMVLTNITVGRSVSMSIGYASGYGHSLVLPVNMITETILVLLFYPVFVFSLQKLVIIRPLNKILNTTRVAAERHQSTVRKYGVIGLFTFVWFPFWMTGPVVGSALGYLLRFPAWLTLVSVLSGTYIAMVAWALFLFDLQKRAKAMGSSAPVVIILIFLAIAVVSYFLQKTHKKNHE